MSTQGMKPHVRFIDLQFGVQNLEYFQGSWKQYALTESRVASNNSVHTYASWDPVRDDHVIFIGMSGHVSEVKFGTRPVVINDLTTLAKSSTTAAAESPINGYFDTLYRYHVNYIDSDGHVHELYKTPSISWKDNDLTTLAKSSTTAAAGSPLDGYFDTLNRQHVNYIDSSGHVHELYNTPSDPWKDNDLTSLAGSSTTAAAGSPLDGYWDTLSRQHVNYIDSSGHVHELYNTPAGGWKDNDLTTLAKSSTTAAAWEYYRSPLNGYWDLLSAQHVNYIDNSGHVHELYNTPSIPWKDNDLTTLAGSSTMAAQSSTLGGFALDDGRSQHVYYFEQSGHVHELSNSSGSWKDKDISNGITPTARSSLAGIPSPF